MSRGSPIGVFDSGLGGLTVVRAIRDLLPAEDIIYVGDTAHVPYGNKSARLVTEYSQAIARFLLEKNVKIIVVACNTASAVALEFLQHELPVPVLGVIEPGVHSALRVTRQGAVGVIGTLATVESGAYAQALRRRMTDIRVVSQACPLLVPLVEEGWLEGEIPGLVTARYLQPFNSGAVDTLILGCTHYPLLKPVIRACLNHDIVLVDSAEEVAAAMRDTLRQLELTSRRRRSGHLQCLVTDMPMRFESVAQRFLGDRLSDVRSLHIP